MEDPSRIAIYVELDGKIEISSSSPNEIAMFIGKVLKECLPYTKITVERYEQIVTEM